jgi:hypothetical protein
MNNAKTKKSLITTNLTKILTSKLEEVTQTSPNLQLK